VVSVHSNQKFLYKTLLYYAGFSLGESFNVIPSSVIFTANSLFRFFRDGRGAEQKRFPQSEMSSASFWLGVHTGLVPDRTLSRAFHHGRVRFFIYLFTSSFHMPNI